MRGFSVFLSTLVGLVACVFVAEANAQSVTLVDPPVRLPLDDLGVNLSTGAFVPPSMQLSIGSDQTGLLHSKSGVLQSWRHNYLLTIKKTSTSALVAIGSSGRRFTLSGGVYTSDQGDGETLTEDSTKFIYKSSDGVIYEFSKTLVGLGQSYYGGVSAVGTFITLPNGRKDTLTYRSDSYFVPYVEGGSTGVTVRILRLQSVTSNTGYQLKYAYATNTPLDDPAVIDNWYRITSVTAINNAVEYCNPSADSCSLSGTWPTMTYTLSASGSDSFETIADPVGIDMRYRVTAGKLAGIRRPGESTDGVTIAYDGNSRVQSVTRDGTYTRTYTWTTGTGSLTAVQKVGGVTIRTTLADTAKQVILTDINALSQQTSFTADSKGRITLVTAPEGNTATYAYDTRGNVTSQTYAAKSGSGLSNIVTSAAYPSTCSNPVTCNKPTSTTDARGKVTDYTYDSGHGGVLTVTAPTDAGGIRPQTRIIYGTYQAYYKNSGGSIVASGSNIVLPVQVASCRTTASCTGGTDERKTVIGYGPQSAGTANNLNPVSATTSRGDGALAATTALTYDSYGRPVTVDGPLSGTTDTSKVRYNLAGQVIGEVGPDPDDAGSAKYPATRYSYNSAGQVYLAETGWVDGLSDGDWAAFSAMNNTLTEFDAYGRPVRQKTRVGSTVHQVVDTVYDSAGRPLCSMVRMDPGNWGTVASSCTPTQTGGTYGPDRVTYNTYDALGRVTKVTSAYGIGAAGLEAGAGDTVINTFTANGQLATVKDAEGNLTTYEYDGFDRLVKTRFPSTTQGAGTSSTTDYEQVGYDAGGNVTSFRTRAAETINLTYDNLNRLITKAIPNRAGNWCGLGSPQCNTHTRDVYFGYDLYGGLTYARFDSTSGEGVTNAFDALGQLTGTTTNMDSASRTLSYQYDVAGNPTRITHPDNNYVNAARHSTGGLSHLELNGSSGLALFGYDAPNNHVGVYRWDTAANTWWNMASGYPYDSLMRLSALSMSVAGTGNYQAIWFAYNPAGQISSRTQNNDAFAFTGNVNVNRNYTANGLNQYSAVAGTSFGYDANGNLTSDGTNTFVYDVENRLVGRSGSGTTTTLRYDPLGRLYEVADSAMGTTRFLHDGSDLVAEYTSGGTLLRRYVHGLGAGDDPLVWFEGSGVTNAERRYLFADERGSIVMVMTSANAISQINTYDEHGIPDSSGNDIATRGRFRYTGQAWLPELGMYYYKARMYSPTLGRFMQTDPIGYGDGMNIYAYVGGDPVNGVDPTGLKEKLCGKTTRWIPVGSSDDRIDVYHQLVVTPCAGGSGGPAARRESVASGRGRVKLARKATPVPQSDPICDAPGPDGISINARVRQTRQELAADIRRTSRSGNTHSDPYQKAVGRAYERLRPGGTWDSSDRARGQRLLGAIFTELGLPIEGGLLIGHGLEILEWLGIKTPNDDYPGILDDPIVRQQTLEGAQCRG